MKGFFLLMLEMDTHHVAPNYFKSPIPNIVFSRVARPRNVPTFAPAVTGARRGNFPALRFYTPDPLDPFYFPGSGSVEKVRLDPDLFIYIKVIA